MIIPTELFLARPVDEARERLQADIGDPDACRALRTALQSSTPGADPAGAPAVAALRDLCDTLDGPWARGGTLTSPLRVSQPELHEAVVVHPREKQERQHRLASLLFRVLHVLDADDVARAIERVTEPATEAGHPRLCRLIGECAAALGVDRPAVRLARGAQPIFEPLLYRQAFLCLHAAFVAETPGETPQRLGDAELRFALGHQLEHLRGGHVALLQLSPERLEAMILDEVPFLIRTPIKLATRAVGWTRANLAVKKVGSLLPKQSRSQRVVNTVGELLPDSSQETVLPEMVHEWVRSWIQGVEFSADRAGLFLSGGLVAAAGAMLRLSPDYASRYPEARERGARWLLQEAADLDRPTSDRLREVLRFGASPEYLSTLQAAHPGRREEPIGEEPAEEGI